MYNVFIMSKLAVLLSKRCLDSIPSNISSCASAFGFFLFPITKHIFLDSFLSKNNQKKSFRDVLLTFEPGVILKYWGWLIAPATSTTQNFTKKIQKN